MQKPFSEKRMLIALENIGSKMIRRETELETIRLQRDVLVLEASKMGISRRKVAKASGISAGRVQQIINSND